MPRSLIDWLPSHVLLLVLLAVASCQSGVSSNALKIDDNQSIIGSSDGDLTVVAALAPPADATAGRAAPLSANDLIEIDVFQVDNLDREVRIDERGFISMPLIGSVKAAGLSAAELESNLEQNYGRNYLQSPDISVFVKESIGQRLTLDGEFRKPGLYPVTGQTTLVQAVAQAGGLSDLADPKQVYIFRTYPDGRRVASYSIADIRSGKAADPRLFGGDVVVAFTSGAKIAARNLREALGIATSAGSLLSPL